MLVNRAREAPQWPVNALLASFFACILGLLVISSHGYKRLDICLSINTNIFSNLEKVIFSSIIPLK
jgi:hypothetical protein